MNKSKQKEKAQVAVEYMVIVTFLLFMVGIAAAYAMFTYYENVKINDMRNVIYSLQKASNQVYSLGPGNSIFVEINLPSGTDAASIAVNKEIFYRMELYGGLSDFVLETKGNITEFALPIAAGPHTIEVKAVDANIVFTEV